MLNQIEKNMKKSVLALALAFGVTTAFAQDLTSKKGEPILPEAEDWGIAFDAQPFLTYAQGIFGKTATTGTLNATFLNGSNLMIMGKYFKDEKTAYRVGVNLGFHTASATNLVNEDSYSGAAPTPLVTDKASAKSSAFGISAGMEMRRGKTRLQGYYGADVGIWFGGTSATYAYGNAFGTSGSAGTSPTPNSTSWTTTANPGGAPSIANGGASSTGSRTTAWKSGSTFSFGVRAFVGAEYFFAAKMSLGGEFGWGLGFTSVGAGSKSTEEVLPGNTSATIQTVATGKTFNFDLGTDNKNSILGPTGSLRLNMYFQ